MEHDLSILAPWTSCSAEETEVWGRQLARHLQAGDVLALHGDLGAGKTCLVRGLAAGMGIDPDRVSSPTFTLVHEYGGDLPLVHIDAYRIEQPDELLQLGFDEYVAAGGVVVVEWPERVAALLPTFALHLCIAHGRGDVRVFRWCSDAS